MKVRIALAFAACAAAAPAAGAQELRFERPYWTDRPVIEAQGRAQVEVAANRATFAASFTDTAGDAGAATQRAAERARLAAAAVRAKVGRDARLTTNMSTRPIYETYRDRDGNVLTYDTPDRIKEFAATATLSVTLLDAAKAPEARGAALAAKPDETGELSYSLDLTAEIQRKAFAAAVEDGAARAKLAAAAAGAPLGPLLVLQEGDGPCLGRWYAAQPGVDAPYPMPAPPPPAMMADGQVVAAGQLRGREMKITQADINALTLPSDPTPMRVEARVCLIYAAGR